MGTRFRAYQLGGPGSSFSYCHDGHFTLIEARLTTQSVGRVAFDIHRYGAGKVDRLHITSWDSDHCNPKDLQFILAQFNVGVVEAPGYPPPDTDQAQESARTLRAHAAMGGMVIWWTPEQIATLMNATAMSARDVLLWPHALRIGSNDNSTAKIFRMGHFSVLSLGDLESAEVATEIAACSTAREADVMILAHHGADNGFTSREFLKAINPRVAISTSDYDSQFEHPKHEIRDLLHEQQIDLFTTKTGDVLIESRADDPHFFQLTNYKADSEEVSRVEVYPAKYHLPKGTFAA